MELPWLTTLSGMAGSIVGASATIAVAWVNQKSNNQRELLREDIRTREKLYGDFVGECARLLGEACRLEFKALCRQLKLMPSPIADQTATLR